ncbi:MAG TPA: flagellar type III secretion system pore protein FliP [Tepidisphaeraceae bacterium]|nr:flagellar type III secretion system pore protein FliP [Tepidisphaeraceae bacterium]
MNATALTHRWGAAVGLLCAVIVLSTSAPAQAQEKSPFDPFDSNRPAQVAPAPGGGGAPAQQQAAPGSPFDIGPRLPDVSSRENFSAAMQIIILMTVLSLAPAILIMMTSFTRIIIVLSLLRQALGTQSLPPNQIIIGLAMFMTFLVMGPTWQRVNDTALRPYLDGQMDQRSALARAIVPVREFMVRQIQASGNDADVDLFTDYARQPRAAKWEDVGTMQLIPAFVLSELKTAFLLGFKVYLPFLIIDIVISTILISMGMMMLPPVMISLPFKLLLFVLVDGWRLITGSLMGSFV